MTSPLNTDALTVEETAKVLRISRGLAYSLVREGQIPSVKLGRVIRVPRAGLEALLNGQTSGTAAAPRPSAGGRVTSIRDLRSSKSGWRAVARG
ncbi:MAG: helix-turn-helix domain-containing protein [Ignavibacteriales bacterium]